MSAIRKTTSRFNQRLAQSYRRHIALESIINNLTTRTDSISSHSSLQLQYSSSSENNINIYSTDVEEFNSLHIDSAGDANIQLQTAEKLEDIEIALTSKEISVLLIRLRYCHSLTRVCIDHVCELLQLLKVPNAPLSFKNIETLTLCAYRSTTFPNKAIICPSCYKPSSNLKMCTSTTNCDLQSVFVRAPTESQPFVTLLMNSDGGLTKVSSTSVWLTTFIINELPRRLRFLPENMIIELHRLEEGISLCLNHINESSWGI
ncbi:hypothetical protein I4U23_005728 [Adineta vaga]|nr:hypothetical protein I4U23_005728 [Adineta vaga]